MEKCTFIDAQFISGKRFYKSSKSNNDEKYRNHGKNTSIKVPNNKIIVTVQKNDGNFEKFEVEKQVRAYFRKHYVSRSLANALAQRARISQIQFLIHNGKLIIQ